MEREEGSYKGASPPCAGHPGQQEEEKGSVEGMKQDVHHVKDTRPWAEEPNIQKEREPRERVPVGRAHGAESPHRAFPRKPLLHSTVITNVEIVVVMEQLESPGPREDDEGRDNEQEGDLEVGAEASGLFHKKSRSL